MSSGRFEIRFKNLVARYLLFVEMDPLINSLILENIFGRLGINEQKEFRKVNRTWKDATVKKWRRSALVTINITAKQDKRGPQDFLKLWKSRKHESHPMKEFPFRCFKLCLKDDTNNVRHIRDLPQLWDFWKYCSPKMQHLEIDGLPCDQRLRYAIKWLLLERCEELKQLVLTVNCSNINRLYIPYSWLLGGDVYGAASAASTAQHLISFTLHCKQAPGSTVQDPADSGIRYWGWSEVEEAGYRDPEYWDFWAKTSQTNLLKNLESVASWTRKLRKLALVLNDDTLHRICELWPKLEELTLLEHSTVTEAGIEQAKSINDALKITRE